MVSPVDTSVKWARSTMPGAPVLTRAAGSLIALLDALLVNGWGAQTATTLVVSGGFAEATFPADHAAAPHAVVLVSGVTGALANLNGEQKVTSVKPNKIRWATALPDGTATGVVVVKMAAGGWAKPFSGTNLAVYKSASPQAHGQFLRVNDANVQYARAQGYENMTAVSTGTGMFPTNAQMNGGYYWHKTTASEGVTPVPWVCATDGRAVYVFVRPLFTGVDNFEIGCTGFAFGDMVPESKGSDPFATRISGETSDNGAFGPALATLLSGADTTTAVARAFSGLGASSRGRIEAQFSNFVPDFPNNIAGSITGANAYYWDHTTSSPRAKVPGLLASHQGAVEKAQLEPFSLLGGAGPQSAFLCVLSPQSGYLGSATNMRAILVDLTGPWR